MASVSHDPLFKIVRISSHLEHTDIMICFQQERIQILEIFNDINREGQTILMVTHSTKAASHAGRVLFIKDGELFHQIYRGNHTNEQQYQRISDTLTLLATGGDVHE